MLIGPGVGKPRKYHHQQATPFPESIDVLSFSSLSSSSLPFILPRLTRTRTLVILKTRPNSNQIRVRVSNSPRIIPVMQFNSRVLLPWSHQQCTDTPSPWACPRRSAAAKATTAPETSTPSTATTTTFSTKRTRSRTVPPSSSRMLPRMRSMSPAVEAPRSPASLRCRFVAKFTSSMPLRLIRYRFPLFKFIIIQFSLIFRCLGVAIGWIHWR